jgi:hypothetical protein
VQSRLIARGEWEPLFESGLELLASQCATYLRFARAIRALENVEADELARMESTLADMHRLARRMIEGYLVILPKRVPFAVMNAEGLDADIVDLCRLPGPDEAQP